MIAEQRASEILFKICFVPFLITLLRKVYDKQIKKKIIFKLN